MRTLVSARITRRPLHVRHIETGQDGWAVKYGARHLGALFDQNPYSTIDPYRMRGWVDGWTDADDILGLMGEPIEIPALAHWPKPSK